MNKKEIFKYFSTIIDELIDMDDFFKYFFQNPYAISDLDFFDDNLHFVTGCARGCLVDKNYPYVVKFNLVDSTSGEFYNHCEREVDIYTSAMQDSLESCFIESTYVGTYRKKINYYRAEDLEDFLPTYQEEYISEIEKYYDEDCLELEEIELIIPLFAYEKAEPISLESVVSSEVAKTYTSPLNEYYNEIAEKIIEDYGEIFFYKLSDFLYAYEVCDIHKGNVMLLNNKIVLSDYAGFPSY